MSFSSSGWCCFTNLWLFHPLNVVTCTSVLLLCWSSARPKAEICDMPSHPHGSVVQSFKCVCGFGVDIHFFSAVHPVLSLTETSEMWGRHWGRVLMPRDHCSVDSAEKGRTRVEHFKRLLPSVSGTGGPNDTVVTVLRPPGPVYWKNSRRCTARTNPHAISCYRNHR